MQIINVPSNQGDSFFKDYKFAPDAFVKDLRFHENFRRISYHGAVSVNTSLSVQTNKPVANKYNCFYFEAEKINNGYFCIGLTTQGFPSYKVPGKSRYGRQSIGLAYYNNTVSLSCRKVPLIDKIVDNIHTIGLGVNIITSKIFMTIDGKLEAEHNLPKLQVIYPTVCLKPCSEVRVNFTGFKFDLKQYMKDSVKINFQLQKTETKPENTLFLVKSYLRENGYLETLKSLDTDFEKDSDKLLGTGTKKVNRFTKLKANKKVVLTLKDKHTIRYEVFKNTNWDYLLTLEDKFLFEPRLKANIVLVSFLTKYYNAKDESQKLKIFHNFETRFIELKSQKVYNSDTTIETVINDFILDENIHTYRNLIEAEHKNRILGYLFETHKNNKLSTVIKHLALLMNKNAEYYNFEPGYDLNNLNK